MTPDATPPELLRAAHCSPTRECSQCNATHGNLGGLTEKHGKDWFTLAYCPACKAKTWTKAYRWESSVIGRETNPID